MEETRKMVSEMKSDIQRRLAAVLASRETYKAERKGLERSRGEPGYAARLSFLRQVGNFGGNVTKVGPKVNCVEAS